MLQTFHSWHALLGSAAARRSVSALPKPVRFSVFLADQNISRDEAAHSSSRELALRVVAAGDAVRIGQNAIKLRQGKAWKEIKTRYEPRRRIQPLLPEAHHYLAYNYPLPYHYLRMYR